MSCLLITNDYPPKLGGIQIYLWELWRRLPSDQVSVYTRDYPGAREFDAGENYRIIRETRFPLLPTPAVRRRAEEIIAEVKPRLVLIDPALPLGIVGRKLSVPYGLVLHGAEATIPTQLPLLRSAMNRTVSAAEFVVSASQWATDTVSPAQAASKTPSPLKPGTDRSRFHSAETASQTPFHYIPPGVDTARFHPHSEAQKSAARQRFGLGENALVLLSVSRLVPRKGMDNLIKAAAGLQGDHPNLELVIAGGGRDLSRLQAIAKRTGANVKFLGRVSDEDLPSLYGSADIFAMLCRERWGGLEQEGFGVVFLEAAASGIPQIAGDSGGAAEAVSHGETGFVVPAHRPSAYMSETLQDLVESPALRQQMGAKARLRVEAEFSYDLLAERLREVLGV